MRSDQQLVALFRAGNDEAFRVIHDRYRQRLFAYTRQMLPHRQDAEDALQDVFVRAYAGLRANDRELALRAWLYRVAHNRCIDELRRPAPPPPEVIELLRSPVHDPIAQADQRESLRRLIADVRRLPDQQRSALLMRELGGMPYADMASALGVTVPAVKSLLVRARVALGQALEARDTACSDIRGELMLAHDRGRRPNSMARRHMRDCAGCREFRHDLRGVSRRFAAIVPTLGPLGVLANILGAGGAGGGAAAGGSAVAGGGAVAAGGAAGTGSALVSVGVLSAGAGHVATLVAAAVVTAGGAVEIQHTITPPPVQHRHHAHVAASAPLPVPAVRAPTVAVTYRSDETSAVTPPSSAPGPPPAPATRAQATPASHTAPVHPALSTSTVTTTTVKTKPTGGSAPTRPKSAAPKNQTVTPTTSGASTVATTGGTTTTTTTTTAGTTTPAPADQTPSVPPGSTQTSPTGSTATSGSTASPTVSQTTTTGTGSPAATVPGGSSAPQQ